MINHVILGACMDFMATCKDNEFDLGIVDPPYFDGPNKSKSYYQGKNNLADCTKYKKITTWDIPDYLYFDELLRVTKNQIIWGCNYYDYVFMGGRIIWLKMEKEGPFSTCEIASNSLFNKTTHFKYLWNGFWQENMKNREKRIHPTQKPVALYKWLLQNYALPDQTIFDSHVGSGSSRIACHDLGYDFTGCELDPDYHASQEERYKRHIAQRPLFEPEELRQPEQVDLFGGKPCS